jgi:hypothetical protein
MLFQASFAQWKGARRVLVVSLASARHMGAEVDAVWMGVRRALVTIQASAVLMEAASGA